MKHITEDVQVGILIFLFAIITISIGVLQDTYNKQQDRIFMNKNYEIMIKCRQTYFQKYGIHVEVANTICTYPPKSKNDI